MKKENTAKTMSLHGFTQFELSKIILNNLQQFKLTPTTKLVLLYLADCFNPKHTEIFPKQKTIADKIGVSEASVIRAISELHKEGLIISERKYTNRYKFTSKILNLCGTVEDFSQTKQMQVKNTQNVSLETCNLQAPCIEQKREQKKNTTDNNILGGNVYQNNKPIQPRPIDIEEYQILKEYAIKHNARNINAYIAKLKQNGSDKNILKEFRKKTFISNRAQNNIEETKQHIEELKHLNKTAVKPQETQAILDFKKKHGL